MDERKIFKSNQEVCAEQPRPNTIRDGLDRLLSLQTGAISSLQDIHYSVNGQQNVLNSDIAVDSFCLTDLVSVLLQRQEMINEVLYSMKSQI